MAVPVDRVFLKSNHFLYFGFAWYFSFGTNNRDGFSCFVGLSDCAQSTLEVDIKFSILRDFCPVYTRARIEPLVFGPERLSTRGLHNFVDVNTLLQHLDEGGHLHLMISLCAVRGTPGPRKLYDSLLQTRAVELVPKNDNWSRNSQHSRIKHESCTFERNVMCVAQIPLRWNVKPLTCLGSVEVEDDLTVVAFGSQQYSKAHDDSMLDGASDCTTPSPPNTPLPAASVRPVHRETAASVLPAAPKDKTNINGGQDAAKGKRRQQQLAPAPAQSQRGWRLLDIDRSCDEGGIYSKVSSPNLSEASSPSYLQPLTPPPRTPGPALGRAFFAPADRHVVDHAGIGRLGCAVCAGCVCQRRGHKKALSTPTPSSPPLVHECVCAVGEPKSTSSHIASIPTMDEGIETRAPGVCEAQEPKPPPAAVAAGHDDVACSPDDAPSANEAWTPKPQRTTGEVGGERSVEIAERSVEIAERSVEITERSVEIAKRAVGDNSFTMAATVAYQATRAARMPVPGQGQGQGPQTPRSHKVEAPPSSFVHESKSTVVLPSSVGTPEVRSSSVTSFSVSQPSLKVVTAKQKTAASPPTAIKPSGCGSNGSSRAPRKWPPPPDTSGGNPTTQSPSHLDVEMVSMPPWRSRLEVSPPSEVGTGYPKRPSLVATRHTDVDLGNGEHQNDGRVVRVTESARQSIGAIPPDATNGVSHRLCEGGEEGSQPALAMLKRRGMLSKLMAQDGPKSTCEIPSRQTSSPPPSSTTTVSPPSTSPAPSASTSAPQLPESSGKGCIATGVGRVAARVAAVDRKVIGKDVGPTHSKGTSYEHGCEVEGTEHQYHMHCLFSPAMEVSVALAPDTRTHCHHADHPRSSKSTLSPMCSNRTSRWPINALSTHIPLPIHITRIVRQFLLIPPLVLMG